MLRKFQDQNCVISEIDKIQVWKQKKTYLSYVEQRVNLTTDKLGKRLSVRKYFQATC